jgi:hypothetical protein
MTTLTAPGEEAGLVWDTARCSHPGGETCGGRKGCRVVVGAAELWNGESRKWWRELSRIAKQQADRRLRALGHEKRGGLHAYSWEMQKRGVWHLHIVLGMQTALEREWARVYVETLRRMGPAKGFGFVDAKPLERPQVARRVAACLGKYLAKWEPDGTVVVSETVTAAGRTLLTYVSRDLTALTGCTMRALRNAPLVWAARAGFVDSFGSLRVSFSRRLLSSISRPHARGSPGGRTDLGQRVSRCRGAGSDDASGRIIHVCWSSGRCWCASWLGFS